MAELRIIECKDCGSKRLTRMKNTQYCRVCRLLRNINFFKDRTMTCIDCKEKFAPLSRGEDVCANCYSIPAAGDPRATCSFCGEENAAVLDANITICKPCAHNPENTAKLRSSLRRKIKGYKDGSVPRPEIEFPVSYKSPEQKAKEHEEFLAEGQRLAEAI